MCIRDRDGTMQKILIVEDDIDIQELLRNFLQEVGYEISIANDGKMCIRDRLYTGPSGIWCCKCIKR